MFFLSVPDTGDCHEGRRDGAFTEAEKEAHRGKSGKVLGGCEAHAYNAPDDSELAVSTRWETDMVHNIAKANLHSYTDEFGQGESAHEIDEWILGNQLANIENRARP